MVNAEEMLQAERLIFEIENDSNHAAINKHHPDYKRTNQAYKLLKSKAAAARVELEAQRYFKLKK